MNARGRPLTRFENFKAQLEAHIGQLGLTETISDAGQTWGLREHVARQIDGAWCDLFWDLSRSTDPGHDGTQDADISYDDVALNALRSIALVAFPCDDTERRSEIGLSLAALADEKLDAFSEYAAAGAVDAPFVHALIALLDCWTKAGGKPNTFLSRSDYYDEGAMLRAFLTATGGREQRPSRADWVRFSAYCAYLRSGRPLCGLDEWVRVTGNLARNTVYDRDIFRLTLAGTRQLLAESGDSLLEHLATAPPARRGFSAQQLREEAIKAQLLLRDPAWRALIEHAELHPYFAGQIEFLLEFSGVLQRCASGAPATWSDAENHTIRARFVEVLASAEALFPRAGGGLRKLPEHQHLWERALLCMGDYLLSASTRRYFLANKHKWDFTWKRLLRSGLNRDWTRNTQLDEKRALVGRVLEAVDVSDVEASLRAIITRTLADETLAIPPWRQALITHPELIAYCRRRETRWLGASTIYLLSKSQLNSRHRELYTWALERRLRPRVDAGEFAPLDQLDPPTQPSSTAEEPKLILSASAVPGLACDIWNQDGRFVLQVPREWDPRATAGPDAELEDWVVSFGEIEDTLRTLVAHLQRP